MKLLEISKHVREVADTDGSMLLLHCRTGRWHFLNQTAGAVWSLLKSGDQPDQIFIKIADHFGMPIEDITKDLQVVIDELQNQKMVRLTRKRWRR